MNEILIYSFIAISGVFIASSSQILLKRATDRTNSTRENWLSEYLNVNVIIAYAMFTVSAMIGMYVLRYIPLSLSAILGSMAYIFVPVLGKIFLQERFNKVKCCGIVLIIIGIVIFNL